jgi:hypothetical protein
MERQLSVNELLKNTSDIEELLDVVQNGHPSIDEEHFCWKALNQLGKMSEKRIYKMYADIHG